MNKIKPDVLRILKQHPETRENDVLLAFRLWEAQGLTLDDEQKRALATLAKPGSIVRVRAHVQNVERRFHSPYARKRQ